MLGRFCGSRDSVIWEDSVFSMDFELSVDL